MLSFSPFHSHDINSLVFTALFTLSAVVTDTVSIVFTVMVTVSSIFTDPVTVSNTFKVTVTVPTFGSLPNGHVDVYTQPLLGKISTQDAT